MSTGVIRVVAGLIGLAGLPWLGVAQAEEPGGAVLRLEALFGANFMPATTDGAFAPRQPDDLWVSTGTDVNRILAGRVEGAWDFAPTDGLDARLGVVVDGWYGRDQGAADASGLVFLWPTGGKPEGEISICSSDPCISYSWKGTRSYWEVMPELWLAQAQAAGARSQLWFGLQPFYGQMAETSSIASSVSGGSFIAGSLDGEAYGAMLSARQEIGLSDRLKVFVSGGAGFYAASADGTMTSDHDIPMGGSVSLNGFRGQLGLGTDFAVNPHLSLGLVTRLDYWSDVPYLTGTQASWSGAPCYRRPDNGDLVCEPPRVSGNFGIDSHAATEAFVGLSMTMRQ